MADLSTELVEIIDKMKANGWGSNDIMSFVKTVLTNREDDQTEEQNEYRNYGKAWFDDHR